MDTARLRRLAAAAWPYALLIAAATALVVAQALRGGWPRTHEGYRYHLLAEHFKEAFLAGRWWPRWLPEINGGYGYPTFVFYQPLVFFLSLPFRLLLGDPVPAMWATIACALALGATGSYRLCAHGGSRAFGLFAGGVFLLAPYLYVDLLVRGDLSELLALCLVPWTLHFLRLAADRRDEGAPTAAPLAGLALAITAVLLAHPITGLLLSPALLVLSVALVLRGRSVDWGLLARLAAAGLAALALATPYWQPLFTLRGAVNLQAAFGGYFEPTRHTVHWHQFFGGPWAFAGSAADTADDNMSFALGPLLLAAAASGVVVGWSSRFVRGAALAAALSIAAMTPTLGAIWKLPVLAQTQFPWRMLSVVVGLLVACASGWAAPRAAQAAAALGRGRVAALLALILAAAGWRPEQFEWRQALPEPRQHVRRLFLAAASDPDPHAARHEFLPLTAKRLPPPRGARPLLEAPAGVPVHFREGHGPHDIAAEVEVRQPVDLVLNQLYFPGWRVEMAGRRVPDAELLHRLQDDGRLRLRLDPAAGPRQLVRARYGGPPGAPVRFGAVAVGLGLLAALAWLDRRQRDAAAPGG